MENSLITVSKPLTKTLYNLSSRWGFAYSERQHQRDLSLNVTNLEQEVSRLTVANTKLKEAGAENNKLRQYLNFLVPAKYKYLMTNIISQPALLGAGDAENDLILDKGSKDGLRLGLAVINEDGIIVGKITELKDRTARACLITNYNCELAATVQNQTRTIGLTDGSLGLTIKMSFIPQSEKINVGDTVITSGLGGNIPRGLVIGKVIQVDNKSNEIWQELNIEPLINLDNLTIVTVVWP
ncbi:MAG: rod shape-determining protein MreC [Candidatus Falkowbacteria bacterium]|nr:rod shape-determining protein MreC [Candidatus Falkowbacteria bacterium]